MHIIYTVASSDSEEETVERDINGGSSDRDNINEQGQGEVNKYDEGVQLFAGHTPLGWRKGGAVVDKRTERKRRKKKRKKLDKETKETLRRQEVSETLVLVTPVLYGR